MTRARRHPLLAGIGLVALCAAIGLCEPARAQGWDTVVAVNPPTTEAARRGEARAPRQARAPASPPRVAASPAKPAPAAAPVPVPAPAQLPPLATVAAETAALSDRARPNEGPKVDGEMAREYCIKIADAAADARVAWQKKVLADLEDEIAKRVVQLEEKTAEYQKWLARRDEFSKKAQETVVTIYARMRPDAAAAQLVAMDEEMAAAVLTKLEPRSASLILNEMDAAKAARLTATIAGAANVDKPGRPKAQARENRS
ncbi:MAG: MotE family protein [Hyphomicrobiaceae bacterium]